MILDAGHSSSNLELKSNISEELLQVCLTRPGAKLCRTPDLQDWIWGTLMYNVMIHMSRYISAMRHHRITKHLIIHMSSPLLNQVMTAAGLQKSFLQATKGYISINTWAVPGSPKCDSLMASTWTTWRIQFSCLIVSFLFLNYKNVRIIKWKCNCL